MRVSIALAAVVTAAATAVFVVPAQAADSVKPAKSACSEGADGARYACMKVDARSVPAGEAVTFSGKLSPSAVKNLGNWTKGDNTVCLTRYKTKPESDGGWPSQTLDGVCTTVNKNGTFTIQANLGRPGTFYYGLTMGPCQGSSDLCGNGDPGLVGVAGPRVVALTTS